jgi:type IV pilus assembly protein PilP
MLIHTNKIAWLVISLCLAGSVGAQEKIESPSQGSKDAVDKLKATPNAVGKTLQALGKTVGAKLGLGEGEVTSAKVTTEVAVMPTSNKPNEEAQPPKALVVGKRDPFRPFTLNIVKAGLPSPKSLSPLERYELGQLKLVGVIWDVKQPNAIVEDAAGLGYVVRTGTPIGSNEGKIKRIQPAGLVIEEFETDVFGTKRRIERNMRLATEKAE